MGNYLPHYSAKETTLKGTKRRRESDEDAELRLRESELDKIQEEILNTPKRRKLTTTSEYIYHTLFVNGEKSDVTICALGREWKLHRVYLCQSGYFSSMFNRQWKESEQNTITIEIPDENIDHAALDIAFGSLYQDELMIKPTMVIQVLAAATLLSLDGLIQQCTGVMVETVSVRTVCDYHTASIIYGQTVLNKVCQVWLEQNLMMCQSLELLTEIDPELMTDVIKSHNLLVMQVEMDVYSMLKKWLFLQFQPQWAGSLKDLIYEAEAYFRAKGSCAEFLDTEQGVPYCAPFRAIRLHHIINDLPSTRIIEEDHIMPKAWLMPVYRKQWLQMLRVEQGHDKGPSKAEKLESVFSKEALRCGRILQSDSQFCWRWTGFSFGIDILVSFTSRLILIKRNTLSQPFPGAVGMQNKRHVLYQMTVSSFNKLGHRTYSKTTGLRSLSLGKDQEQVILAVDRKAEFPLHISCSFLIYTPRDDLDRKSNNCGVANRSSSIKNTNEDSSNDSSNSSNESSDELGSDDLFVPAADFIDLPNNDIQYFL